MANSALTLNVTVEGVPKTLAAFRRLPRQADKDLRRRTLDLSRVLAARVAAAARTDSPQSALMAPTVRAVPERVPVIEAGGTARVGSRLVPAYKIVFGSEFGARTLHQFRPHVGRGSYWLWRTVEKNSAEIAAAWERVAADVERSFAAGGV